MDYAVSHTPCANEDRRFHVVLVDYRQWNMDIIGVAGVEAEAELLAAIIHFFERVGLTPQDAGIKVWKNLMRWHPQPASACLRVRM